ncbi:MAG TPA: NAD(P)-dependent oxidoreductase [Nocardioidaceae bacterium]|nr:NAD(P)-dependent oxidoreductase [Nocardioidaceae bacterium]
MRVAVTGATGVIGSSVLPALIAAGHDVVGLARTPEKAAQLEASGAEARVGSLADHDMLVAMFEHADAVCNFVTQTPVGYAALWPGAWRSNDRLRTEGVRRVVAAAHQAGVRRIVQESVSSLYADQGDDWITEASPLAITAATEPASVGESHIQGFACESRVGVVLRFGTIVGDDELTRFHLRAIRHGRPIGVGAPEGWAHVVHTDDLGPAVLAALSAPSGIYNAGAEPVRRVDLVAGFAEAAGRESIDFAGPVLVRLGGSRLEPLTRSLRVSSRQLHDATGWKPHREAFEPAWLETAMAAMPARS